MGEKIQFYPLDVTYKIIDGRPVILLFSKTLDGKKICVLDHDFEPYFYVLPKDISAVSEKIKKIQLEEERGEIIRALRVEEVKKKLFGKEVTVLKVVTQLPKHVPGIKKVIQEWDMVEEVFEYDILFARRYLIDKKIIPMTLTEADGEFTNQNMKVPAFRADTINQVSDDSLKDLKVLAFDIETYNPDNVIDTGKNPIIMLALYANDMKKVITWKPIKSKDTQIEVVKSEAELIQRFVDNVEAYKPDVITGYYSDGFDFPYLQDRANKYNIKLDIGLDNTEINIDRKGNISAQINGIVHIDAMSFIRRTIGRSMNITSFSLESVATELLGEGKKDIDLKNLFEVWDSNKYKELEEFCKYNLHDAYLVFKLLEKIYPHIIEMIKIVGQTPFTISRLSFSQLVEWYLLRQAFLENEIAPNKPDHIELSQRRRQTFTGAFVFEPKPGFYKDIVIFDFRSLYPTIISSHNIDINTFNCGCCKDSENTITDEKNKKYWFCTKKRGFLSALIEDIITRRRRVKEILSEKEESVLLKAREQSLKMLANSFYGYLGFAMARWYSIECARAVTAFGRYHIKEVIKMAEKAGFKVIYSDTDSVFLDLNQKSEKDAKKFVESVNSQLPGIMELEYEGFYPSGIFVGAKEGDAGAKKRYALIDKNDKIIIKGFETVRRNYSIIGKEIQENVLKIILKENDKKKALDYLKEKIKELRDHKVPIEKVTISTQLSKDVSEYTSIGPHVAIAKKMIEKGIQVRAGSPIKYVIVRGSGKIREKARLPDEISQEDYDPDYYVDHQIIPGVEKIFAVLGITKDDILSEDQSKLDSFFG
ncbi:MAG: DNA-directed DNA polymerase [Candidatus Woesearchaeota archaeon]